MKDILVGAPRCQERYSVGLQLREGRSPPLGKSGLGHSHNHGIIPQEFLSIGAVQVRFKARNNLGEPDTAEKVRDSIHSRIKFPRSRSPKQSGHKRTPYRVVYYFFPSLIFGIHSPNSQVRCLWFGHQMPAMFLSFLHSSMDSSSVKDILVGAPSCQEHDVVGLQLGAP